jgi:hypothetical protein
VKVNELAEKQAELKLQTLDEYQMAVHGYRYQVCLDGDTELPVWLANKVDVEVMEAGRSAYFQVTLHDVWAWNETFPIKTLSRVLIHTFRTVIIEERKL